MAVKLPADHPQRILLNDEVHARPSEALGLPARVSYLVLFTDWPLRDDDWRPVSDLARRFEIFPPGHGGNHFSADFGRFSMKWERHTEFTRYTFFVSGVGDDPFGDPALSMVPGAWLADLPGQLLVAAHAAIVPMSDPTEHPDHDAISRRSFAGNMLVGASVAGGKATAFTDFRVHGDGFSRFLVLEKELTPWQRGRLAQRLLEIETYRMMALLALPVTRSLTPALTGWERELVQITSAMTTATEEDEQSLLDRLTSLEAAIESRHADTHYRFGAAAAYHELVQRRIGELREQRLLGLQTFQEFTVRRLAPAMNTCLAVAQRQESLSRRVARATQLLTTRVEVTRERQSQALLETMNRRAKLQLRLQETVEGLSVVAISYYVLGILGYGLKGIEAAGVPVDATLIVGISVPVVLFLLARAVARLRRFATRAERGTAD